MGVLATILGRHWGGAEPAKFDRLHKAGPARKNCRQIGKAPGKSRTYLRLPMSFDRTKTELNGRAKRPGPRIRGFSCG
jgi:hypothetical protein